MKPHALLVCALVATFITGCASLDKQNSPELYETATSTGTNIDKPGLPPNMTDQYQLQRAFRGSNSMLLNDPTKN